MRRVLKLLIAMAILYICIQFGFKLIEKGHKIEYKITTNDNQFVVNEVFTKNVKNETDNYYFIININDSIFDYQTFKNFNMQSKVIKDIEYYKDDSYECILPVFVKGELLSDIICKKDNVYYNYHDIKNTDTGLDNFATSLENVGYNYLNFDDSTELLTSKNSTSVYNNLLKNHFIGLENYKGIYTINLKNNEKIYNSSIFSSDVYTKNLSAFVSKYYLVADYTKDYKFNEFTLIDITNNTKTIISYDYDINMDSYVQGVIDNLVYVYDRSTKKQYEIDVKHKTIIEVGNETVGYKKYINNDYIKVNTNNDDFKFSKYATDNNFNGNSYAKVDKTGITKSGYYYIYEFDGTNYKVYRSNIQNGITKTYLFTTDNIGDVSYFDDYIYYRLGNIIKRYSESDGIRTVLADTELGFNTSIKFNVYKK